MGIGMPHLPLAHLMVELSKHKPSTPVVVVNLTTREPLPFDLGTTTITGGEHDGQTIVWIGINPPTVTPTEDGL
jgi:hypothetical protein